MRFFNAAIFLATIGLAASLALTVRAAGDVLAPMKENASGGGANLGLMPRAPTTGNAPAEKKEEEKPILPSLTASDAPTPLEKTLGFTPAPLRAQIPSTYMVPTQVIRLDSPPPLPPRNDPDAPPPPTKVMSFDIAGKPQYPRINAFMISRQLGVAEDQVAARCRLSASGTLGTDKSYYTFDTGTSSHAEIRFDGTPATFMVTLEARCDMLPLPQNAGFIIQKGDKYAFMLQMANCAVPPPGTRSIVLRMANESQATCEYK